MRPDVLIVDEAAVKWRCLFPKHKVLPAFVSFVSGARTLFTCPVTIKEQFQRYL